MTARFFKSKEMRRPFLVRSQRHDSNPFFGEAHSTMAVFLSIKASIGLKYGMRHSGRSQGLPATGPVVRCAKTRVAPNYSPKVDIKAIPRIPTAGFLPREQLGDLVFAGTAELKRARFKGAVICVSDGILDPEFAKTPDLLPRMSGLSVLSRSQLELEMHLCLSQVTPEEAAAYVFAGADIVTLHLESFLMPNVGHSVDHEALLMCLEAVVSAGGRAGIAVYPTMSPNAALTRLGASVSLHLLSHLTVIMGDVALATPDRRWRYIPAMENKINDARALLADLEFEAEHIKVVALGRFNAHTISHAAAAAVDTVTIADLDVYRFVDDEYARGDKSYDVREAGKWREVKLYGRPDLSIAEAAHSDAMHRGTAARNIKRYLARQWGQRKHPDFGELE